MALSKVKFLFNPIVKRCIAIWFFVAAFGASADLEKQGDTEKISLLEAYQLARDGDPALAISRFGLDGATARRDAARGKNFPQVSLFGEWSQNKVNYDGDTLSHLPSQNYAGERYGLQLRSPLFNGRNFREYGRQSALVGQSTQELAIAETELLARVVEAYLSVLLT